MTKSLLGCRKRSKEYCKSVLQKYKHKREHLHCKIQYMIPVICHFCVADALQWSVWWRCCSKLCLCCLETNKHKWLKLSSYSKRFVWIQFSRGPNMHSWHWWCRIWFFVFYWVWQERNNLFFCGKALTKNRLPEKVKVGLLQWAFHGCLLCIFFMTGVFLLILLVFINCWVWDVCWKLYYGSVSSWAQLYLWSYFLFFILFLSSLDFTMTKSPFRSVISVSHLPWLWFVMIIFFIPLCIIMLIHIIIIPFS